MTHRVASAKIPERLLDAVDAAAADAGFTRNGYIRRVLEAATRGEVQLPVEEERIALMLRESFARDRRRYLAATSHRPAP